jgi:REase_DpnII-MboI
MFPYIGDTIDKATAMIIDIAKKMALKPSEVGGNGAARNGWTVNLKSEYDCQNLFFTVVKPWISNIAKEEVTVVFDDQEKSADFSFFNSKLIIEMKFIDSDNKKREVVKTLEGLTDFYKRHTNVNILLMLIFVKEGVAINVGKWEADFTYYSNSPKVITHVIYVP